MPTRRAFEPDPMPEEDYTSFVLRDVASDRLERARPHHRFRARRGGAARINATVGVVESIDEATCVLVTGADSYEMIAVYIGMLGLDFEVTAPSELVAHLALLAQRYARAVGSRLPREFLADRLDEPVDVGLRRVERRHPAHLAGGAVPVVEAVTGADAVGGVVRQHGEDGVRLGRLTE